MKKVCHMTSVHAWNDTRIFLKECKSLAEAGYDVYLVAAGDNRETEGVHIIGCGQMPKGRRARIVYEKALEIDCDIYHLHDPELLPYGVKLKHYGKKVIFDSHEDVPEDISRKRWIPVWLRKTISSLYKRYESYAVDKFDAVVTSTPHIAELFTSRVAKVVNINNYPRLDDINFSEESFRSRGAVICYAGGISEERGEGIMHDVMREIDGCLILAGPFDRNGRYKEKMNNIEYCGVLDRAGVNSLYGNSVAGLILLKPNHNFLWSLPIKMFEYMAAGIPFVCSDFPAWKAIVKETGAGICVPVDDIAADRKSVV